MGIFVLAGKDLLSSGEFFFSIPTLLIFAVSIAAYLVLHELTHGAAYYLLTRQKLTFGLTFSVAFCDVPQIYVYKKAALIALLAPFVLFDMVFLLGVFLSTTLSIKLMFALLFSLHFGGCVGDLYCTILLLLKFKVNILVNDTGPKQTFYSSVEQN